MSSLVDKWQARLMPIANKIGNQKFLVALRDSFIGTMPVIMTALSPSWSMPFYLTCQDSSAGPGFHLPSSG